MQDRVKWALKIYGSIFGVVIAIIAIIGLIFGKVIEGSLIAEVGKWAVMAVVVGLIVVGLAYVPVSLIGHRRDKLYPIYGKDWFKMWITGKK